MYITIINLVVYVFYIAYMSPKRYFELLKRGYEAFKGRISEQANSCGAIYSRESKKRDANHFKQFK